MKGAVTEVKNQGGCRAHWAFSTVAAMESKLFFDRYGSNLSNLSFQQVLDCAQSPDNGCKGGRMDTTWGFITEKGLEEDVDYPNSKDAEVVPEKCNYDEIKTISFMKHAVGVKPFDVLELKKSIALRPTVLMVDATAYAFKLYRSGVLKSPKCGRD